MSATQEQMPRDVTLLLPWYAAGTLEPEDMARVEAALRDDPALQAELDLVLEDMAATRALSEDEAVPATMASRFDALFEQHLDAGEAAPAPASSIVARLAAWLQPPRRLAFAAAAAALVIALQAGIITTMMRTGGGTYDVASGQAPRPDDRLRVLVKFADQATMADIGRYLSDHKGLILAGPKPGDMYELGFRADDLTVAALVDKLSAEPAYFALVLPGNSAQGQ